MIAKGTFDIELIPKADEVCPAGRMLIKKSYSGGLTGTGKGQMISKRTDGPAAYFAVEEVVGSLAGRSGSFTLLHQGLMDSGGQTLEVTILSGSGAGDLEAITGSMVITQEDDGHQYQLSYELE